MLILVFNKPVESTSLIFRLKPQGIIKTSNVISSPMVRCKEGFFLDPHKKCRQIASSYFPSHRPKWMVNLIKNQLKHNNNVKLLKVSKIWIHHLLEWIKYNSCEYRHIFKVHCVFIQKYNILIIWRKFEPYKWLNYAKAFQHLTLANICACVTISQYSINATSTILFIKTVHAFD